MELRTVSDEKTHSGFVSHLPEDVVDGVAQESFSVVGRQKFGPEYRHELLEVHLAVPCGHAHQHRGGQGETDGGGRKSDRPTGKLAEWS